MTTNSTCQCWWSEINLALQEVITYIAEGNLFSAINDIGGKMEEQSFYYRRNPPHYQPENATYFVTFRLAGSLPQDEVIKLKEEYDFLQRKLSAIQGNDQKKKC